MTSFEEALAQLLAQVHRTPAVEPVDLHNALGRVLATDLLATHAVPPADNSAMDGYALRLADAQNCLPISQRITAGQPPAPLQPGTAARIFTGGEIPLGADVVVMQENTRLAPEGVSLQPLPALGDNIRRRGQDVAAGSLLLVKGQRLGALQLGLAASQGWAQLPVYAPVKVALINSGNELAAPGQPLQAGQIYNSNGICLASLLRQLGCQLSCHSLADDLAGSQALLAELAPHYDVLISTGGVSAGEEDHLKAAVAALGRVALWKVAIKPGKPLMFGQIGDTPIVGLPGNPVSACITFLLFAKPFIERLMGSCGQRPAPYLLPLLLDKPLNGSARAEFLRVRRSPQGLVLFANQSSGVLSSLVWAEGLALHPANQPLHSGDRVAFWPLSELITPH